MLAGRERVGLAVPGLLAQRGVRLGHEPRRAAADHRHPRAGRREGVGELRQPGYDAGPVVGLPGDLALQVAVRVERHGGSLATAAFVFWISAEPIEATRHDGSRDQSSDDAPRPGAPSPTRRSSRTASWSWRGTRSGTPVRRPSCRLPGAMRPSSTPGPGRQTLLPGLVDVHCHGGACGEFGAAADSAATAVRHHHVHGTTTLLGSLVSAAADEMVAGVRTCAALVAGGDLAGIDLEGPFLSYERRGAQDPAALTDVDTSFVEAVVLAAESAGAPGAVAQIDLRTRTPRR